MPEKNATKQITVGFVALGCPKNIVDSERMLAEVAQAGFVVTTDADNADVVVVNTCGFIAPARAEAIDSIKRALKRKKKGAVQRVIVAGCLPQREGEHLLDELKGVDAIIGLGERDRIAEIIRRTIESDRPAHFLADAACRVHDDRTRLRITPAHYAYLRISEGCSRGCSFCTIPAIRGPLRSKPVEMIVAEAKELAESGAVELNIIAQDVTSYGSDLGIPDALPQLLAELQKIAEIKWFRLLYLHPTGISDELLDVIAENQRILRYIDVPLQHVNKEILRQMHRPGDREDAEKLIDRLRSRLPECILRTTFIVGFPGETDEQFAELLGFVKRAGFDQLGCFPFYAERGTAAAAMSGQVAEDIKRKRLAKLMLTQQEIAFKKNEGHIGSRVVCLLDSIDRRGIGIGRFYGQAPEIDSVCILDGCTGRVGSFVEAEVVTTSGYDLVVRQRSSRPAAGA